MCGTPGEPPPASLLSGGRPGATHARVYSLVLLLLVSGPAIALSESLPPPGSVVGSVVPSEPVSGAQQDLTRVFEEAMQAGVDALQSGNTTAAVAAFERAVALQPRQAIAQALLGSALLAAERAEEALGPLDRAVELDPALFIAQQNLGLARLQTARPGEAAEALEAALGIEPGNPSVQMMLGRALTLANRPEEAVVHLRVVAEGHPDTFLAHRYLGSALLALGRFPEARASLAIAARMRPEDVELQLDLARAHQGAGERDEAVALLERVADREPSRADVWTLLGSILATQTDNPDAQVSAAKALEQALELKPGDTRASLELTSIYYLFRLHEHALDVLDNAVVSPSEKVDLELERFRHLQRLDQYEAASAAAERAIEAGAGPEAYYYLGFALTYLRDFDGAIRAYRTATEKDPGLARAHRELGDLLIDRQLYEEARAALESVVAADPADAEAHYLLGLALFRAGEAESAIPSFERAVQLDPEHASAYYNLATVLRMTGRAEEGMAAMRSFQALQADQLPGAARMDQYLANLIRQGVFLAKMDRGERAVELFQRALENDPESDLVLFNLGLILSDLTRHQEAADVLERAIESNPDRAEAYGALANAYRALGRTEDALRMRARYEELRRQR
jgi:tetratricopeptide (TPR) repeat protein